MALCAAAGGLAVPSWRKFRFLHNARDIAEYNRHSCGAWIPAPLWVNKAKVYHKG